MGSDDGAPRPVWARPGLDAKTAVVPCGARVEGQGALRYVRRIEDLAPDLPPLVLGHLERNVPASSRDATGVLFHQRGTIRMGADRPWLPFSAEQTIDATCVGFVWHARFRMAPLVTGVVEDAFEDGKGRLDAKIWGLIPVAHARGIDVDRGEAERYLAELPWCPTALLHNPDLRFEQVDDRTVKVWAFDRETYVDLRFDAEGDIVGARTTTRVRDETTMPWEGRFWDYRDFGGVRAPARGEVWWEEPGGPMVYWKGELTDLELRSG